MGLLHFQQLNVKHQGRTWWDDRWKAILAIRIVRRTRECSTLAHRHLGHALVPTFDHHAHANREAKRLAAITGGVELFARCQRTSIMH